MDFGRAFSYVFDDTDWFKKIGLAALVSLIPIIGQIFLLGWGLNITKNVINNDPNPLPELDFGNQLGAGFKAFVVGLVLSIPVFILMIPSTISSALLDGGSSDAGAAVAIIVSLCSGILTTIFSIALGFAAPAAYGRVAKTGLIGDGLNLKAIWSMIKTAPVAYLIVLAGSIVSGLVASLGIIACGIGVILTSAYAIAVNGHLWGQAYREAVKDNVVEGSFQIPNPE